MADQKFGSYYDYLLTVDSLTKTAPSWEFSYNRSVIVRSIDVQFCIFSRTQNFVICCFNAAAFTKKRN